MINVITSLFQKYGQVILIDINYLTNDIPKEKSTALWNVDPALSNSKGMHLYSNVPQGVVNVVLCWSCFLSKIWLYLEKQSNIHIMADLVTLYKICSMFNKG